MLESPLMPLMGLLGLDLPKRALQTKGRIAIVSHPEKCYHYPTPYLPLRATRVYYSATPIAHSPLSKAGRHQSGVNPAALCPAALSLLRYGLLPYALLRIALAKRTEKLDQLLAKRRQQSS